MERPPESDSTPPRKNRARERHMRRKNQTMAQPTATVRQIKPVGSFEMPEIRIPGNRVIVYGVLAVIVLALVILALGSFKGDTPQTGSNAIWLGNDWTYGGRDETALEGLVQRLRDHKIGIIYAWVSLLQPNNTWSDTDKLLLMRDFVQQLKTLYPESRVYGWLSVDAQPVGDTSRLADESLRQIVADFSQRMTAEFGFDGVMLNVVPVTNGDENYLTLLRSVRTGIGEGSSLSVAVSPDWTPQVEGVPQPPRIEPGTVWEQEYKQRIALIANQIVVTAYNSGFQDAADYSTWMTYQVESFAGSIIALETNTELLIGVPAYSDTLPSHDTTVENIQSAVAGVQAGMSALGDRANVVNGLAVYAEWQTTDTDWADFKALWAR
ncbi:MAG: hypothetical protein JNJ78_14605 [Anaerolineae bacterium]|nr:hypothetical protein [Anaerolineae bacterium]